MRHLTRVLLPLFLSAGLVGCTAQPHQHRGAARPSPTTPSASALGAATPGCIPAATVAKPLPAGSHSATIAAAYRGLLKDFVRPPEPSVLLTAAWQGALAEAAREDGGELSMPAPRLKNGATDDDWQSFASAYDALSRAVDGRVDQVQMAFAAVTRMADSLQEGHTYFVNPESYAQEGRETHISGIGVVLSGKEAPYRIDEVIGGGPAARAGVHPGDALVAVDGCEVAAFSRQQLSARVRGAAGTPVHLTIDRPMIGQLEIELVRAEVTFPALESRLLAGGIGLVGLRSFPGAGSTLAGGETIGPELDAAVASFRDHNARGWVLDLRGDPGGRVDGLQAVAGRILPKGTIFSFADRNGRRVEVSTEGSHLSGPPLLAVLVDGRTASAAEILASAIQDEGVAPVIGATTAGVANGAQLIALEDGAGLSITHWQTYTVHGRALNGAGVTPDIAVQRTAADLAAGLDPPLSRAVAGRGASGSAQAP